VLESVYIHSMVKIHQCIEKELKLFSHISQYKYIFSAAMNTNRSMKVKAKAIFRPQHKGFVNTIYANLYNETKEFLEDQNGAITLLRSYRGPHVSPIKLKPHCFSPLYISHLLQQSISHTRFCQDLGEKIAHNCAYLSGLPLIFEMFVVVELTQEVLITLPSASVAVPSKAASSDVLQRLVEEQKVESIDLEEEKKTCSICMENLNSESSSENIISCLHLFHQSCIFESESSVRGNIMKPCEALKIRLRYGF